MCLLLVAVRNSATVDFLLHWVVTFFPMGALSTCDPLLLSELDGGHGLFSGLFSSHNTSSLEVASLKILFLRHPESTKEVLVWWVTHPIL